MGKEAIYKCIECGNEFTAKQGGGFYFIEYRCVDCDSVKSISSNRRVPTTEYKELQKKK